MNQRCFIKNSVLTTLCFPFFLSSLCADSSFEMYAKAHLSVDNIDNKTNRMHTIASNASRLGVRASYEIQKSLYAIVQLEMGVDLSGRGSNDDGNGGDFNSQEATNGLLTSARDSYVGVQSDFGTLIAGNIAGQNQWIYDYNLFADQVGDLGNLLGAAGVGPDRSRGSMAYISPVFESLQGRIVYKAPSSNEGSEDLSALIAKLDYTPIEEFKVSLSYIRVDLDSSDMQRKNPSQITLNSSYITKEFSFGGGYASMKSPAYDTKERSLWYLGGSIRLLDATTLKAHYVSLRDEERGSDASTLAIGVDYDLAKQVRLYFAGSTTKNGSQVNYSTNNWGHGQSNLGIGDQGADPVAVSFGFIYDFAKKISYE